MTYCPPGLAYLPFQQEGIKFIRDKSSALIADEMGLGKTIQAIGWINSHPEIGTVLVVCPASLKINWRREMDKWLVSPCVEFTVINYDILHKLDFAVEWDLLIIDEAHYAKSKSAKRSRLVRIIKAKNRLALTGTPIINKPIDLWHILHILKPEEWPMKSYLKYAIRYCGAYHGKWGWVMDGATHLAELKAKLQPLMIRRMKDDVLKDLPPKVRQIIEIPTNGISADLREKLASATEKIDSILDTYRNDVRKMETLLQVAWTDIAKVRHLSGMYKAGLVTGFLEDAIEASGKVVIFAHHRDVLAELYKALDPYHPVMVHGGTSQEDRQKAVDKFQTWPDCGVFIGQIQAAGTGITLTAASHVIFVELDWSPLMFQAEDRCHRIGQRQSVLIQHLCLENSLDVRMAKALVRKQKITEAALNPEKEGT